MGSVQVYARVYTKREVIVRDERIEVSIILKSADGSVIAGAQGLEMTLETR